jgi:hypothetical protein
VRDEMQKCKRPFLTRLFGWAAAAICSTGKVAGEEDGDVERDRVAGALRRSVLAGPSSAHSRRRKYDPGATDTEIKIG